MRSLSTVAVAVCLQVLAAGTASGAHLSLKAIAICSETGSAAIQYSSTSWSPLAGEGENSRIDVSVNGVFVASHAFVYPGLSFTGVVTAPAGTSAVLSAVAIASWGDGRLGGQTTAVTVALPRDCPTAGQGRFTGGGSQIRIDSVRVTRGLTIHCDLMLSNNLEVNWNGNKFHMTEHLTTVECSDSPDIIQAPPVAPLDTLVGVGTGRYNGMDGFTITFTLVDYGEPGSEDRAALKIHETANPGNVVLNVPLQVLSGGNLQAHYDQPHK